MTLFSRWLFLEKNISGIRCLTGLWKCLWYNSTKTWSAVIYLTKTKDCNLCRFLPLLNSNFLRNFTLQWDIINQIFNTHGFDFKLIHSSSWIHAMLTSHHLPVPTHFESLRSTLSNFLVHVKKSKVNYPVLFYHYCNEVEHLQ